MEYFKNLVKLAEESSLELKEYFEYVYGFAQKHHEIIRNFGRFPHRNEILNRRSVPAEKEFLSKNETAF